MRPHRVGSQATHTGWVSTASLYGCGLPRPMLASNKDAIDSYPSNAHVYGHTSDSSSLTMIGNLTWLERKGPSQSRGLGFLRGAWLPLTQRLWVTSILIILLGSTTLGWNFALVLNCYTSESLFHMLFFNHLTVNQNLYWGENVDIPGLSNRIGALRLEATLLDSISGWRVQYLIHWLDGNPLAQNLRLCRRRHGGEIAQF